MASPINAPINLAEHVSLIYAEGVFGLNARKKFPMRAKTADGILRYAEYPIAGIVDSTSYVGYRIPHIRVYDVLGGYLDDSKNVDTPIFSSLAEARDITKASVLLLGAAPEGGGLPREWENDILTALQQGMHVVSGMHYPLKNNAQFSEAAKTSGSIIWDVRSDVDLQSIPVCSSQSYHITKPIVLTVGTDAAIGKMTTSYELARAAQKRGMRACVIPTGQTSIMIEGWGISIDALPADFMAGAVEKMLIEKQNDYDIFFVEGQGSLFHPAFSNTCISLIHGAVPTHMVLVHRPARKHSIGSKLVALPSLKEAIKHYESSILPTYRDTKVAAVALNTSGMSEEDTRRATQEAENETGLPVGDVVRDKDYAEKVLAKII
ncbi:MAG: DUF1611 domain-containing protein [Candidatus Spechtbacteria bacterium]|nr:DUF1611 domain-containing protein [Candidatus Spechtbacteria bacterium]